mmetsp:Transcript_46677/g.146296  ORF Transcript_46677/g.146296 Transcript_46677/m.146296 type:complete len:218 (-) Transcript_46677:116-769(-)
MSDRRFPHAAGGYGGLNAGRAGRQLDARPQGVAGRRPRPGRRAGGGEASAARPAGGGPPRRERGRPRGGALPGRRAVVGDPHPAPTRTQRRGRWRRWRRRPLWRRLKPQGSSTAGVRGWRTAVGPHKTWRYPGLRSSVRPERPRLPMSSRGHAGFRGTGAGRRRPSQPLGSGSRPRGRPLRRRRRPRTPDSFPRQRPHLAHAGRRRRPRGRRRPPLM